MKGKLERENNDIIDLPKSLHSNKLILSFAFKTYTMYGVAALIIKSHH